MNAETPRAQRPRWVRIGLWSLETRGAALFYFWLCIVLVVGLVAVSIVLAIAGGDPAYWIALLATGVLLSPAALWYSQAIRWVDQHDRWK